MIDIIFTIVNAVLAAVTLTCTIVSIRYTKKQTEIMQKQLEASLEPDYPTTQRLQNIALSIQKLGGIIKDEAYKQ